MTQDEIFTPDVLKHIRAVAFTLLGNYGFTEDDLPFIHHEMKLAIWRGAQKYDSTRSAYSTYTNEIVKRVKRRICLDRHRLWEKQKRVFSIEEPPKGVRLVPLARPATPRCLLVRIVIQALPPRYRQIGKLYLQDLNLGEIAEALGQTYAQFYQGDWQRFCTVFRNEFERNQ